MKHGPSDTQQPSHQPRLWIWFVVGFLVVMVGLLFYPMYFYDGRALFAVPVWRYYALEIQRAWSSSGSLGAPSGASEAAVTIVLEHLLFAVIGGAIAMGMGWLASRLVRKRQRTAKSP
jgi:hypothetical protein